MFAQILILLVVSVAVPLLFAWTVWRLDEPTRAGWFLTVAYAVVFTFLVMVVSRWDMAGYYTRVPLVLVLALAIILSWRRHAGRPWRRSEGPSLLATHWSTLLPLAVFTGAAIYVATGLVPPGDARALALPLQGGHFMVGQGGGNVALNHHANHASQRHAVDIMAIGPAGFRAAGLYPSDPEAYAAFGARVVSPCSGEVVEAVDDLPDFQPPESDPENPAGNHVVIACQGLNVLLAHLRRDSLVVEEGEAVETHHPIGEVGNSGNTTEPHLHIHAVFEDTGDVFSGEAAPITLDGRNPVRNVSFRR
jgi:hypothetical protein